MKYFESKEEFVRFLEEHLWQIEDRSLSEHKQEALKRAKFEQDYRSTSLDNAHRIAEHFVVYNKHLLTEGKRRLDETFTRIPSSHVLARCGAASRNIAKAISDNNFHSEIISSRVVRTAEASQFSKSGIHIVDHTLIFLPHNPSKPGHADKGLIFDPTIQQIMSTREGGAILATKKEFFDLNIKAMVNTRDMIKENGQETKYPNFYNKTVDSLTARISEKLKKWLMNQEEMTREELEKEVADFMIKLYGPRVLELKRSRTTRPLSALLNHSQSGAGMAM